MFRSLVELFPAKLFERKKEKERRQQRDVFVPSGHKAKKGRQRIENRKYGQISTTRQ